MQFLVALHTDDGNRYGVTVPELPGCFSAGDTREEALEMAAEAIQAHIEGLRAGSELVANRYNSEDFKDAEFVFVEAEL